MALRSLRPETKFETPREELEFLRAEVRRREQELAEAGSTPDREALIREGLESYQAAPPDEVAEPSFSVSPSERETLLLGLSPEPHDRKIEELIRIAEEKGIKNALSVTEALKDPHLYDDLHRFLVQYVKRGLPVRGAEGGRLSRALAMTLFEVLLPEAPPGDAEKNLKTLLSGMEQFYAGMLSVGDTAGDAFSIEIANANGSDEFIFYVAVPDRKRALFEKQIIAIFPHAKVREHKDDYNVFNDRGVSAASVAEVVGKVVFPLKTYDDFDVDPLSVILNSFSKIDRDGEGAAVQLMVKPAGDFYTARFKSALEEVKKGVPLSRAAAVPMNLFGTIMREIRETVFPYERKKNKEGVVEPPKVDEVAVEEITKKASHPIAAVNLRVVASAADRASAEEILRDLESAFNQFENTRGLRLRFRRIEKIGLLKTLRQFSMRTFSDGDKIPLNLREIASLVHFPNAPTVVSPELRRAKAGTSSVPPGLPHEGILLGVNRHRGSETSVYLTLDDRLRHFYTVGQTGTGKTTLLKSMIVQDMEAGRGLCFIDPHGADAEDLLSRVPEKRFEDLVYFDPAETARPMALNMLEYDRRFPDQKTFVVNEMLSIFEKLFNMKEVGGPMFEQYFRNAVLLTIEDPSSGSTLIDVARVLSNKEYRDLKLSRTTNPIVRQFWREVAEKAGGEASLQNIVPYITSKFDGFLANDIMRPIVAQERSTINFREIMDTRKILIVNLAKGRLGDINASLLGLIIVGKMLMAALSRVDSLGRDLPDFYLYIDEFQNVTTPSIATILSEARKYRLSLSLAHQFIKQLDEKIKDAVFGNVGSMAVFRVGPEDAEFLEKQFEPVFRAQDLINLDNRNAYIRLLAGGRPARPFSMETLPLQPTRAGQAPKLKELSSLKYGRERAEVEAEIMERYKK